MGFTFKQTVQLCLHILDMWLVTPLPKKIAIEYLTHDVLYFLNTIFLNTMYKQ